MSDPFDVLRRSADGPPGSTVEIDPAFRAELLDEARRRLAAAPGAARRRAVSTAEIDERTDVIVVPVDRRNGWQRPMLLAAASVVLVTATALAVAMMDRAEVDEPAATAPVNATSSVPANPTTTVPADAPLTDEQLIAAIRLDTADLDLSDDTWVEPFDYAVIDIDPPDLFDLGRYSGQPECAAFDQVLEPLASSTHSVRTFGVPPNQPAVQIVAVLSNAATAAAVFDGLTDPAFAPCLERYSSMWVFRFGAPSDPPFAVTADDFAYYTYEQPTGQINAGGLVRVGRTLTFVDASITWFEPARPLMSEEAFGRIIDRVVARATAALDGNPLPTATATPQPSASVSASGSDQTTSG